MYILVVVLLCCCSRFELLSTVVIHGCSLALLVYEVIDCLRRLDVFLAVKRLTEKIVN